MSIRMMNLVWTRSSHKGSELLLLLAIADNASDAGRAFPGIDLLARKTRLTTRAVQYALKKLLECPDPELELLDRGRRGRSNLYQIRTKTLRVRPDSLKGSLDEADGWEYTKPASPQPSGEPSEGERATALSRKGVEKKTPKPRAPDVLWDALVSVMRSEPGTKSERGRWNAAVKELREAEATPEQVGLRARAYQQRWPEVALTPTALSANWGSLAERLPASPEERRVCPECDLGGGHHLADCSLAA